MFGIQPDSEGLVNLRGCRSRDFGAPNLIEARLPRHKHWIPLSLQMNDM